MSSGQRSSGQRELGNWSRLSLLRSTGAGTGKHLLPGSASLRGSNCGASNIGLLGRSLQPQGREREFGRHELILWGRGSALYPGPTPQGPPTSVDHIRFYYRVWGAGGVSRVGVNSSKRKKGRGMEEKAAGAETAHAQWQQVISDLGTSCPSVSAAPPTR